MRASLVLVLGLCSCAERPTSILVTVSAPSSPSQLFVSVYDPYRDLVLHRQTDRAGPLPATFLVENLPAVAQTIRVVVAGSGAQGDSLAGGSVAVVPGAQATLSLALAANTPDSDGDGVPDAIDDCPTVPDREQTDTAGSGPGDACVGDMGVTLTDGAPADRAPPIDQAGADLALVDQAPADLTNAPDLAPPPSLCNGLNMGFLLCDGFENGLNQGLWDVFTDPGHDTITVDTQRAMRGTHALHVHVDATAKGIAVGPALSEEKTFPANPIFVRVFYSMSGFPGDESNFVGLQQLEMPQEGVNFGFRGTGNWEDFNYSAMPDWSHVSATEVAADGSWHCIEVEVASGMAGEMHVWLDENEIGDIAQIGSIAPMPAFDQLLLGFDFDNTAAVAAFDAWFDEVVVAQQRIHCDQ